MDNSTEVSKNPSGGPLGELVRIKAELGKMLNSITLELKRRKREVASVSALLERQIEALRNLKSRNTKVVVFQEYKTIRLSVALNIKNLTRAESMVKEAEKAIKENEAHLQQVTTSHEALTKELASRGQVLQFPKVPRGRTRKN